MSLQLSALPWWKTDSYQDSSELGPLLALSDLYGPKGLALVQAYENGSTSPGWGREAFMLNYLSDKFRMLKQLKIAALRENPFALVMRSAKLVCIDIDGKNGGFDHVSELGYLAPTTAEKSKSGNGYHLFYTVKDDWDEESGFAAINDQIGVVQGVDLRAVGCVYHHPQQRWNHRAPVPLSEHLSMRFKARALARSRRATEIQKTLQLDTLEVLMLREELVDQLQKPIPHGKRNTTLFAFGCEMKEAGFPDWEDPLLDRGRDLGLDNTELGRIIDNVQRYS